MVQNRMLISADLHVLEPDDLWTKPLHQKYSHDAVPRMVYGR